MGARFEALDEGVLAAASKSTGYFFAISISQKVRCCCGKPEFLKIWSQFSKNVCPSFKSLVFISYYIKQRCSGDLSIRSVDLDETLQGSSGDISKNFLFWGQPDPCGRGL